MKSFVIDDYPKAYAKRFKNRNTNSGHWIIFSGDTQEKRLGYGNTSRAAWGSAMANVNREKKRQAKSQ